ncbi:MAG TPA: hypothetical protein VF655_11030 [Allosphingosinicella sp.]|jgi:hypothetical protein
MRALLAAFPLLLLAACSEEPENIQTKADNMSRALVEEANRIEAEATANVAAETAPLDNEAEALLNQAAQNAADANAAVNAPEAANGL